MLDRAAILRVLTAALVLGGCSFNGGGVSDEIDAGGGGDRDDDSIPDATDNCPDDANRDQRDEDGDEVGNACDNCPGLSNADQANAGETGAGAAIDDAGDACDPDPTGPGNDLLLFDGFDDADSLDDWRTFLGGNWTISGGAMRQSDVNGAHALYLGSRTFTDAVLDTQFAIDDFMTSTNPNSERSIGTIMSFSTAPSDGAGYLCLPTTNPQVVTPTGRLLLLTLRGSQGVELEAEIPFGVNLLENATYRLRQQVQTDGGGRVTCSIGSSELPAPVDATADDNTHGSGFVGLRTQFVEAHFDYIAVYALPAGG